MISAPLCCVATGSPTWVIRFEFLNVLGQRQIETALWPGLSAEAAARGFLSENPEVLTALALYAWQDVGNWIQGSPSLAPSLAPFRN